MKNKEKWAFGFSVIAVILSIIAVCIAAYRTPALGFDYQGIIVAMLSLAVTFFVAVQIYQSFTLKRDIDQINNSLYKQMKKENEDVLDSYIKRTNGLAGTFAKEIGVTPTQIYDLQSGKTKRISEGIANKILLAFPRYDKAWLLSGEGEPFGRERNDEAAPRVIEFENFPFVSQKAYAGYLSGWADEEYVESLPTVAFPVDHTPSGKYLVFEVKGDSMDDGTYDSYLEGDLLLCRQIGIHLWAGSKLHFKRWDFVIVHEEGVIVKRIVDHDVENHTITVHSLNPDKRRYPDRVIDLSEVRQILNVVSMMRPRKR